MTDPEDLQQRLRALFLGELEEAVEGLNAGLLRLEQAEDASVAAALVTDLFRTAHSMKGAAMSAGVDEAVGSARQLEAGFARLRDGGGVVEPGVVQELLDEVDALDVVAGQLRATVSDRNPAARIDPGDTGSGAHDVDPGPTAAPGGADVTAAGGADAAGTSSRDGRSVRIAIPQVDDLVGRTGDLMATAGRVRDLASALAAASDQHAAAAPRDVTQTLDRLARSAATVARDVDRVSDGITSAVENLTLQPFLEACAGLDRTVRDTARATGKQCRLVVNGGEVQIDRAVVALLREPLLHLVRNAVDHGIDDPGQRESAGKPAVGTVTITAGLQRGQLEVTVADDGRGVDRSALRRASASDALVGEEEELALAFRAGVSTAADVTDVSGRGVGLDVVRTRLEAIGGTATMHSTSGVGTTVTLTSPLNLALLRVIMVRAADQVLALPLAAVERLVDTASASLRHLGGQTVATVERDSWPVVTLAGLLGQSPQSTPPYLVLMNLGGQAAALAVEELLEDREIVALRVPQRLVGISELLGVTLLSDGRPALVLNPATIVSRAVTAAAGELVMTRPGHPGTRRVLVAEDTLTTRVLQQRILEGAGYAVSTAVDGAQAWEMLQRQAVALVISDVDMPGMNGIELCRAIRASPALAGLPVVLVTSLGSEADRRRGVDAGADAYLVKAEFSAELLLDTVARLL